MYKIILIPVVEILVGTHKKGKAKKCAIDSEWTLATLKHPKTEKGYIIILNKSGKWLKFKEEEINTYFKVEIRNG